MTDRVTSGSSDKSCHKAQRYSGLRMCCGHAGAACHAAPSGKMQGASLMPGALRRRAARGRCGPRRRGGGGHAQDHPPGPAHHPEAASPRVYRQAHARAGALRIQMPAVQNVIAQPGAVASMSWHVKRTCRTQLAGQPGIVSMLSLRHACYLMICEARARDWFTRQSKERASGLRVNRACGTLLLSEDVCCLNKLFLPLKTRVNCGSVVRRSACTCRSTWRRPTATRTWQSSRTCCWRSSTAWSATARSSPSSSSWCGQGPHGHLSITPSRRADHASLGSFLLGGGYVSFRV